MEKHQRYLVSLVDKVHLSGNRHREDSQGQVFAVASDGKRLIRLARKPEVGGEKCQVVFTESDGGLRIRVEPALGPLVALPEIEAREVVGRKIPRPANAFMLFANEWRKKLAGENPRESNKDISVRLGGLWKTMPKEDKEKYFTLAREVDAEHKRRYPDYVYNPKEARLRKAMRDQSREQHQVQRPHQQQQSPAGGPSNTNGNGSLTNNNNNDNCNNNNNNNSGNSSGNGNPSWFTVSSPPAPPPPPPPLPPAAANGVAASSPATHPKPILSPRVMAAHQRTLDKTKDVIRKQLECGATDFSGVSAAGTVASYHQHHTGDYPTSHGAQDAAAYDYSSEAQKWHPYQNGMSGYHSRSALISKMNSLNRGMPSLASHATSAWGQFCSVPFPASQSASNRHMVFLQQQQHCNYPSADVRPNCSYEAKMQDGLTPRLNPSFPREEAQVKSCGPEEPNSRSAESPDHQRPRTATATASPVHTARSTSGNCAPRQPLPGFQQAFGSTEIGKFSRSELFASLVEAASNVSSGRSSSNSSLDDQSATRTTQQQQPQSSCAPTSSSSSFDSCSARSSSPELLGPGTPSPCYGYARLPAGAAAAEFVGQSNGLATSSLPRWHSPYVGAVGSEF